MLHRSLAVLAVVALSPVCATAEVVTIEHSAVGCVVAERYPQFEARFAPVDAVAKARILFQSPESTHWYAVAMHPEGAVFRGVLPKPKKSLQAFRYYIEATDKSATTARSADQTANVVGSEMECQGRLMASTLASASVALEVPAGAPAVPAGFGSAGVAAAAGAGAVAAGATAGAASAGGGFPTAIVIGAGAAAAAGGAVVVAKGRGPETRSYSGAISGEYTQTSTCGSLRLTCTSVQALTGTATVRVEESDGSVTGDLQATGTATETRVFGTAPRCPSEGSRSFGYSCNFSGAPGALTCRFENTQTFLDGTMTNLFEFSGALTGSGITGTVTLSAMGSGQSPGGFCTAAGSGGFPLDLR